MADQESVSVAIARMEEQIKQLDRRMGSLEKLTETVSELALSVKELAASIKQTDDNVENLRKDVVEIHDKPAKRWETIVTAAITAIVGLIIGRLIK